MQKVLRSLEVAGDLLEELSKLSSADQDLVKSYCEDYLGNLQVKLLPLSVGGIPSAVRLCSSDLHSRACLSSVTNCWKPWHSTKCSCLHGLGASSVSPHSVSSVYANWDVQEVQQILIPAIQKFSQKRPYEGNSYLARTQADAASSHADALMSHVGTLQQSLSEVSYAMRGNVPSVTQTTSTQ